MKRALLPGARARGQARQNLRMFRPSGRLTRMQLGIALTPIVWLVVIGVVVLGGIGVRSAGARGWWVIAGIAALLVATNPSADDHDNALRSEVRSILRHEVDRELNGAGRFAAAAFEHFGGDKAVSMLLDVDYQNFVLFSRATLDGKVVAVGVLGNVFVELPAPPSSSRKRQR